MVEVAENRPHMDMNVQPMKQQNARQRWHDVLKDHDLCRTNHHNIKKECTTTATDDLSGEKA